MKEETMLKIVNEINDALWDLKFNKCNVDTKEKGWETYYGLDIELIDYIRKLEQQLEKYKNIIKEVREYLNKNEIQPVYLDCKLYETDVYKELLKILDKGAD